MSSHRALALCSLLAIPLLACCGSGSDAGDAPERGAEPEVAAEAEPEAAAEPDSEAALDPEAVAAQVPDPPSPEAGPLRERGEFARLLGTIRRGMPEAEVARVLGEPEDRRTERDPGGLVTARTSEIWSYGSAGHLSFATLGRVTFDERGRAQYVYGGDGSPPDPSLIGEGELRAYLRLVDRVPSYDAGASYDPLALIRAVNALQPLGEARAIAVIGEYLRVASALHDPAFEGVMLLLRVLFETESPPTLHVGAPVGCSLPAEGQAPLFPIVVHQDVPHLVVDGYMLGGAAQPPGQHLDYYRAHGTMRSSLLRPGPQPEGAPAAIDAGPCAGATVAPLIAAQVIRLVRNAYQPDSDPTAQELALRWPRHAQAIEALSPRWDGAAQEYQRGDGSRLADPPSRSYPREIWRPEYDGLELRVTLERQDPRLVSIEVRVVRSRIRLNAEVVVGEQRLEVRARPGASWASSAAFELPEGESIRLRLEVGDRSQQSELLRP